MHLPTRHQGHEWRNSNYERDIVYITKQSKWILKSIGIWPTTLNSTARFLSKIAIGFCSFVLLFAIIPCILYMLYEEKDTIMKLKLLGLLCFCTTSLLKYWALTVQKPGIENCIEEVRSDWKQVEIQKDREMMLKFGRTGRNLTILCAVFMFTGGVIYHTIMQYTIGTIVDEHNRTVKPLVYPTYSALFDAQASPVYELVYTLHCMCGYVMYSVTTGACGLAALFATHACGQIDIIMSRLNKLAHGDPAKGRSTPDARLIEIVQHHLRVLRFSTKVEMILQEVCFLEFISSAFIICLVEYYCLTDWKQSNTVSLATYMILLVSLIFNIFILCYIGELLIEKSTSIGLCCFMIDWVQLPTKTIHGLILIIAMSNNPAKITAGKIVDLSLFTFGNILKTSLAYLSFFRTTVI